MKLYFCLTGTLVLFAAALAGCPKSEQPTGGVPLAANGHAIYDQHCAGCHSGKAPNLDHIGAQRDSAWIVAHVKNPKVHNPGSRMPAFEGKMSEDVMKALGDYLASKK